MPMFELVNGACTQCHRETMTYCGLCRQCSYVWIRTNPNRAVDHAEAKAINELFFDNFDLED